MGTTALRHFLPAALGLGVVSQDRADRFFARFDALDAGDAPHLGFMTRAWTAFPLADLLARWPALRQ